MNRVLALARRAVEDHRHRLPTVRLSPDAGRRTVYVLTPDFAAPSGGVRVLYRHVDLLREAGIPAYVLHTRPGFRCTWFDNDTAVTNVRDATLGASDLLVLPEVYGPLLAELPAGLQHVVMNQSGHLTWSRSAESVTRHYLSSPDLKAVVVVSEHSARLLRHAFPGTRIERVRVAVDTDHFHPGRSDRERRIAYLPRRGSADAKQVFGILRGRGVLEGWDIQPINGNSPAQVAETMRRSMLFCSFAYQEGFGLPALEAMASGCYVVGFHGFGGAEFFLSSFSAPVATGDVLAMARAVEYAISLESAWPGWCKTHGQKAAAYVRSQYSPAHERSDVIALYTGLLGSGGASRSGGVA